jgi:hypothetical protein
VWVLADYSNIDPVLKLRGLEATAHAIVSRIGPEYIDPSDPITIRMYGGWYQGDELSKLAQTLSAEIAGAFPMPVQVPPFDILIRVNVELARGLVVDPSRDLFHTYRLRGLPGGIAPYDPPFEGCCSPEACPIAPLYDFFRDKRCPSGGCTVRPKQVLYRAEQKLADTMLVADLVHLASSTSRVVVVSSDDDIWPGIRTALSGGASIIHLQSKRGQSTPEFYKRAVPSSYIEIHLVD